MTTASPQLEQALQLFKTKQKDEAVILLRQIIRECPDDIEALIWLGRLSPDLSEGITAIECVLELDPGNEMAQRGLMYLKGQQANPGNNGPQKPPSLEPDLPPSESLPAAEVLIHGADLLALAGSVSWPFKDLNRPLNELLAEGLVQPRDLTWAVQKAYSPTVKWTAAVCLKARALQSLSLSIAAAQQVIWPFKDLHRPIGELLANRVITLHDLAWAVANAYDAQVRDAAAVLGAELVREKLAPAAPDAAGTAAEISVTPALASDQPSGQSENAPPKVPRPEAAAATLPAGQLRVVTGSGYLREQEQRKDWHGTVGWSAVILALEVIFCVAVPVLLLGPSMTEPVIWGLGLMLVIGLMVFSVMLLSFIKTWDSERDHYAAGRQGEERAAELLRQRLSDQWTLFRNVLLPDGKGDIDAVLMGPTGIFVLEVKAYSGYTRNIGQYWQRKAFGVWGTTRHNPTRQVRSNALRLHGYLKKRGVDVYIEPRVVWAGSGKLWLEKPDVTVWQLSQPPYLFKDLEQGRTIPEGTLAEVQRVLTGAK